MGFDLGGREGGGWGGEKHIDGAVWDGGHVQERHMAEPSGVDGEVVVGLHERLRGAPPAARRWTAGMEGRGGDWDADLRCL